MEWKQKIEDLLNQITKIKNEMYPDKSWKPEHIPRRKDFNLLHSLVDSMLKDFQWMEDFKNPKKGSRKIRLVELKPVLSQFMRLKERGLTGYPEKYILLFHLHYLYSIDALEKNQINTEKFTPELKSLYPELNGKVSLFTLQKYIKNYVVLREDGKRKTIENYEKNIIDTEISFLKNMKDEKENKEEFKKKWERFYFDFKNLIPK